MKYINEINKRKTFAIISHPDAGKTTLTEKFLLFGGAIQMAGQARAKGAARRPRAARIALAAQRGRHGQRARLRRPWGGGRRVRSDVVAREKGRGISVSASAMSFDYGKFR